MTATATIEEFRELVRTRRHRLAPDMVARGPVTPKQLEAMVRMLRNQPPVEGVTAAAPAPARKFEPIPDDRYAVELPDADGKLVWKFYLLKTSKSNKKQYVSHLVGQPGSDYARYPVSYETSRQVKTKIRELGFEKSHDIACDLMIACLDCGSPLSDDFSRSVRRGSHCYRKFMKGNRK